MEDFYPFGNDNYFPSAVQKLLRKSPVLRGALNSKTTYALGKGFTSEDTATTNYLENVNANGETLNDVFKKLIKDDWNGGNAYIEIVTTPGTNALALYHRDWTTGRVGRGAMKGRILFYDDWTRWRSNKKDIEELPIYPKYKRIKGNNHSVIHVKDYEPEFKRYGLMDWVAGMNAGAIGYMTDEWNISRLENDMRPSGVLVAGVKTKKDSDDLQDYFNKNFKGKNNAGEVMFITADSDGKTSFSPIQDTSEGNWINLRSSSAEDIVKATNWWEVLMGGSTPGKLGVSQELRNTWSLAMFNVIQPKQDVYIDLFKKLIKEHTGLNSDDLSINNVNPIGYADKIEVNSVMTVRDALSVLNMPINEERKDLDNIVTGNTGNKTAELGGNE